MVWVKMFAATERMTCLPKSTDSLIWAMTLSTSQGFTARMMTLIMMMEDMKMLISIINLNIIL